MNGMGSRVLRIHRIIRTLIVFAFVAGAALAVTPAAGASPSSPSTIRPLYVECASIVWQNTAQTLSGGSLHVMIGVTLQKAVDAHDFTFCGLLRTSEWFSQTDGYCDTFYAAVRDYNGGIHATNSAYTCADGGSFYSLVWSGRCAAARGWDAHYGVVVETIGDCY